MMLIKRRSLAGRWGVGALGAVLLAACMPALSQSDETKSSDAGRGPQISETIYVANATGQHDLNELGNAMRNTVPRAQIFGDIDEYAITVHGTAEEVQAAKKIAAELDRPRKLYRITYNIHEMENGKRTETKHYALIVASGAKTVLKIGSRVPIVTGMYDVNSNAGPNSQVQYLDVGLNIEATIEGVGLKTRIEQSRLSEQKSGIGLQDPVVGQTMLEGVSTLATGKPMVLGSIDVPGTTRQQEIEVLAEQVAQ